MCNLGVTVARGVGLAPVTFGWPAGAFRCVTPTCIIVVTRWVSVHKDVGLSSIKWRGNVNLTTVSSCRIQNRAPSQENGRSPVWGPWLSPWGRRLSRVAPWSPTESDGDSSLTCYIHVFFIWGQDRVMIQMSKVSSKDNYLFFWVLVNMDNRLKKDNQGQWPDFVSWQAI